MIGWRLSYWKERLDITHVPLHLTKLHKRFKVWEEFPPFKIVIEMYPLTMQLEKIIVNNANSSSFSIHAQWVLAFFRFVGDNRQAFWVYNKINAVLAHASLLTNPKCVNRSLRIGTHIFLVDTCMSALKLCHCPTSWVWCSMQASATRWLRSCLTIGLDFGIVIIVHLIRACIGIRAVAFIVVAPSVGGHGTNWWKLASTIVGLILTEGACWSISQDISNLMWGRQLFLHCDPGYNVVGFTYSIPPL